MHDNSVEKPTVATPIIAGRGQMGIETSLMSSTEDDNHSIGGWEKQ